jgi:hypothetical protein
MILVMIGALNVILLAMQQQDKVTQAVVEKSNSSLSKLNEEISISDLKVTNNNKLNITITNSGGATAKLASIYIVNETAKQQFRYDLNGVPVDGRTSKTNIGTSLALNVKTDTKYSVKIVTAAGNTATSGITPLSATTLPLSLTIIPPSVPPGNNVTVLYTVTNNITDSTLGWPVTPTIQYTGCTSPCVLTKYGGDPAATVIPKGNTAIFKWTYKVGSNTPDGTTITFNASLAKAKPGNYVRETALAKLVEASQVSQNTIIVSNDLIQKPEIFLVIPAPFGISTSDKALWGVVVVNPTNQTMTISRLAINLYTSQPSANQRIIISGAQNVCTATYISPPSGWSCPHDNLIQWADTASPISVAGYGIYSFLFKIQPGNLVSGPEPAFNISVGVFTSLGQFSKTGLSSSIDAITEPLINVYRTDIKASDVNPNLALDKDHMFGHQLAIPRNTTRYFNIAFADMDTSTGALGTNVKSGTKLIINVPSGFTNVAVVQANSTSTGFVFNATYPKLTPYSDGTTQIIAITSSPLGDSNAGGTTPGEVMILQFKATTPFVNATKVYIMHILADGQTNASTPWSVGPVGQIALQVIKQ